ncbi:MAG: hypothetical protein LBK75_09425 [Oscillospiraceae bacterium]|jgi:hypothetical protein|nr:hypothetical protein [Oscillospiraceae bacterium]
MINYITLMWFVETMVRLVCTVATLFVAGYYGAFTLVATVRLRRIAAENPALLCNNSLKKSKRLNRIVCDRNAYACGIVYVWCIESCDLKHIDWRIRLNKFGINTC